MTDSDRAKQRFFIWLLVLLTFFAAANLSGFVRPMGLKPFHSVGFPFTVAVWGMGVEEYTDWTMLVANCLISLVVSVLLAWCLALWRRGKP